MINQKDRYELHPEKVEDLVIEDKWKFKKWEKRTKFVFCLILFFLCIASTTGLIYLVVMELPKVL